MSELPGTIGASGEAIVPVSADVAWLRIVLLTEGRTVSDATSASAQRLGIVLDSIRETEPMLPELVREDERTLTPQFDEGHLTGYVLERVMRAQMPPEAAGVLLDVAIMAGAAPGSGIVYGVRDATAARARAGEAALSVAVASAHAAAHSLGRELLDLREAEVDCELPTEGAGVLMAAASARVSFTHRAR
ncbi:MAG: SIMPL domain-containing protein [Nannocystaceae bacterium]|nr:SIMPL domain-containing protein [Nannocystaceae bacterium]